MPVNHRFGMFFWGLTLVLPVFELWAQDRSLVFGGPAGWDDFRMEGLGEQRAQDGGTALVLTHGEYPAGLPGQPAADLLLHFNVKDYEDLKWIL